MSPIFSILIPMIATVFMPFLFKNVCEIHIVEYSSPII